MSPEILSELFSKCRTIAVIDLSAKTHRASFGVARYMQAHGYKIVPVNPTMAGSHILDEYCFSSLSEAVAELKKSNQHIDIVDCFRKAEDIPPIADEAIKLGLPCLWMQLGIANNMAAIKARAAGMLVVMDRCIKIDHFQWLAQHYGL